MIEIRHRKTRRVLRRVGADTLVSANLSSAYLQDSDLRGRDLRGARPWGADLSQAQYDRETKGLNPFLSLWDDSKGVRAPGEVAAA